jgi:hypothetical protein
LGLTVPGDIASSLGLAGAAVLSPSASHRLSARAAGEEREAATRVASSRWVALFFHICIWFWKYVFCDAYCCLVVLVMGWLGGVVLLCIL